ncbi:MULTISPECIES: signal peptidase [Chryseobacterium]|uniref:Signal peptidase n=1 Tax=Chryseobacterium endophyticum TaxID=1854762 RepID=A0AAU6WS96_9FLAO|nr:signal peptidase [uncultured Chryseobacterium sp.]
MRIINKLVSAFFLIFGFLLINAQKMPPAPDSGATNRGAVGPGAQSSPIDMYVFALVIIAVMFIVFFTKKYTSRKA